MLGRQEIGIYLSRYESARKLGYLDQARLSIYDRKTQVQRQGEDRPKLVTETFANGEDHAETVFGKDYVDGYRRGVSQSKLQAEGAQKTAGELYLSNIKTLIDRDAERLKSSIVKSMTQGLNEYSVQKATHECARIRGWDVVFNANTTQTTRRIIERWINVRAANIRRERRKTQKWNSQSSEEVYETIRTIKDRVVDESTSSYAKSKIKAAKEEAEREATLDEDEIVQRAIIATEAFAEFCNLWQYEKELFYKDFDGETLDNETLAVNNFQTMADDVNTQINMQRLLFPEMENSDALEAHRLWAEAITAAAPYALAREDYTPIEALQNWTTAGIKILLMYMQSQINEMEARRQSTEENVAFVEQKQEEADQKRTENFEENQKLRAEYARRKKQIEAKAAQKRREAKEAERKQQEALAEKERAQKALRLIEQQSQDTQQRNKERARAQREKQKALETSIAFGRSMHKSPKEFVKLMERQRKADEAVAAAQKQEENVVNQLADSLADSFQRLSFEETMQAADGLLAEDAAAALDEEARGLEEQIERLDSTTPASVAGMLPGIGALEAAKPKKKKKTPKFRTWLAKNYGTLDNAAYKDFLALDLKNVKDKYIDFLGGPDSEQAKRTQDFFKKNKKKVKKLVAVYTGFNFKVKSELSEVLDALKIKYKKRDRNDILVKKITDYYAKISLDAEEESGDDGDESSSDTDNADDEEDPVDPRTPEERELDESGEMDDTEEGQILIRALGNMRAGLTIAEALKTSYLAGLWAAMKLKDSMFETNEDRADFIRDNLQENSEKIKKDEAFNDVFVEELEATLQKLEILEFADLLEEWKDATDQSTPSLLPDMMIIPETPLERSDSSVVPGTPGAFGAFGDEDEDLIPTEFALVPAGIPVATPVVWTAAKVRVQRGHLMRAMYNKTVSFLSRMHPSKKMAVPVVPAKYPANVTQAKVYSIVSGKTLPNAVAEVPPIPVDVMVRD